MRDGRAGWDELAADYDRTRAFPGDGERIVPAEVARTLRALGATRILDLSCGTGRYTLPLARAVDMPGAPRGRRAPRADAAAARLVAEGADLDARHDAPVEVRLVIGRL